MSKKLKNLKWNTVALEGFPASVTENLQGFVGLEECTTYGMDKESKRPKKVFLCLLLKCSFLESYKIYFNVFHKEEPSVIIMVLQALLT